MKFMSNNNEKTEPIGKSISGSKTSRKKTCSILDWTNLFVSFSLPVAIIVYTIIQNKNDSQIAQENRRQDADLANRTRQLDLFLADDQQKETVLNNYFQFLSKLLEKHGTHLNRTDKTTAQAIARLNTLSALEQLDPRRKSLLIRTLYEAKLLSKDKDDKTKGAGLIPLHSANLSYIDLSVSNDDNSYRAYFISAILRDMWLNGAVFRGLDIIECDFYSANLNHADLSETIVRSLFLHERTSSYDGLSFIHSSLKHTRFIGASYEAYKILFLSAEMDDADLRYMICKGCLFAGASMVRANLSYATFGQLYHRVPGQNPSAFHKTNLTDSTMYNTVFNNQSFHTTTMVRSNMFGTHFKFCTFNRVAMSDASLEQSRFENSSFNCSILTNVIFRNANLYNVTFSCTNLINTTFMNADLRECTFTSTSNLTESNFEGASLINVTFGGSSVLFEQLSQARILHNVILSNRTLNVNNDRAHIL